MNFEKLGNIAEIKTGKYDVNHSSEDGKYPFYTCAIGQFKSPTFSFEGESIILPGNGANVGEVFFNKEGKFEAYQRTYVIQNIKENPKYLYYFFKSNWKRSLTNSQYGSATNYIRLNNIIDFKIPIPTLSYQLHITNILTKAENLISQRKESIRILDEYLKSTFLEMFGNPGTNPYKWKIGKLEASFLDKPLIGSMVPAIETGTIPIVRVGEIGGREINYAKCKYSNLNAEELRKYYLKNGDILLARAIGSEVHLGKASIFNDRGFPVVYDSHVMRIRFDIKKMHPEFFYTFLQTNGGRKRFMRKAGQTAIQFNINSKQISDIDIPMPPIELQNHFALIVEKTEALKTHYKNSLAELENLYDCLSQKAFRGELSFKDEGLMIAAEPEAPHSVHLLENLSE